LQIQIDAWGKTPITRFDGADIAPIEFLKYDITALPFFLVTPRQVLNIGAGGGKDVLTALAFDAKEITAVELNPIIVNDIMLDKYSEFSGNLFRHPRVRPVVDEGRGFLRSTAKQFDIIQLSLTHTFSGALAGALSLTENNIYTVESFKEMIDHLSPGGLMTVTYLDEGTRNSRLTMQGGTRIAGIASAALEHMGIEEPQQHMLVATHQLKKNKGIKFINVMVSKTSLATETVEKFHRLSQDLGFTVALSPLQSSDRTMQQIVDPKQRSSFLQFFFHRPRTTGRFSSTRTNWEMFATSSVISGKRPISGRACLSLLQPWRSASLPSLHCSSFLSCFLPSVA